MNGLVVLGLWSATAAGVAAIVGWPELISWMNANSGVSSWVQAVGSIAAIGLGMWVVQRQHRLEVRRQAITDWNSMRAALQGALLVMSGVYAVADKIANIGRHRAPVLMDLFHLSIELETLVNALSRFDYLRFETHSAIEGLTVTESLGRTLLRHAQDGHERMRQGPHDQWLAIVSSANECARGVKARADRLHADITALEPPP